ncbi:MAG: biopolymer transporter ExbD [Gammaproteobacteria bacterium]|nr:biopolymer transporter ExbD [Gammaproteobacteria bacterium]
MSMSVGGEDEEGTVMSEINTTPLVDVMLVLLIIFLITIPIITKTIKVDLPKAANIPTQTKPENVTLSVNTNGDVYWNGVLVSDRNVLIGRCAAEAVKVPQPEFHIRGDSNARYASIGRVLYAIQRCGIVKVGFITEPDRGLARR